MDFDLPLKKFINPNTLFPVWVVDELCKNEQFAKVLNEYVMAFAGLYNKGTSRVLTKWHPLKECIRLLISDLLLKSELNSELCDIMQITPRKVVENFPTKIIVSGGVQCAHPKQLNKWEMAYTFAQKKKWTISDVLLSHLCSRFNVHPSVYEPGMIYVYNPESLAISIKQSAQPTVMSRTPIKNPVTGKPYKIQNNPEQWNSIFCKKDFHKFGGAARCFNCGEEFAEKRGYIHNSDKVTFCTKCYCIIFPTQEIGRPPILIPMGGQP